MAGNTIGQVFKITTFGESHGAAIGVIIDGCPAQLEVDIEFIQQELDRRKPGQSKITTQRKESDIVQILSGVFEGKTTGTPIAMLIPNEDQKSKDYDHNKDIFRPSHADFTYQHKYGIRDHRGGGRSSARETAARVAAGALAKLFLKKVAGVEIVAFVSSVGTIDLLDNSIIAIDDLSKFREDTESNIVRCPHASTADKMIDYIDKIRKSGDTVGGIISTIIRHCPIGLGEPVFDKLHADLGKAMLGINAVHAFEYGSGFAGTRMLGSEHNDPFQVTHQGVRTTTNYAGGVLGGISNGEDIYFRVGFKPVATIMSSQSTVDKYEKETQIQGRGRHDPCVLPRAVPIVEAMTALVLADHYLRNRSATV